MSVAAIVHPEQSTVFHIYGEAIVNKDGDQKNNCERNAFKRLLFSLEEILLQHHDPIVLLLDALYADGVTISLISEQKMEFITTIKEGYVLIQVEHLRKEQNLKSHTWSDKTHRYTVHYTTQLVLNGSHQHILVNYFELEQRDLKTDKIVYKNAWITNVPLKEQELPAIAQLARARWKIENETFNTLKNQGYKLEHNFGHGEKFLSTVFALTMILAFMVDQIAQTADLSFNKAMATFKTKKVFWKVINHLFYLVPIMSMNDIYKIIAKDLKLSVTIQT